MPNPAPRNQSGDAHIAVIGAGIVGMSCALWLQQQQFKVTVIDGSPPGSGTSSGNACTIADYACVPVNHPGLFAQLPSLMFSKNSPLSFSPVYALTHLPWLLRFLKHCTSAEVKHITDSLGRILLKTNDGLNPLISLTNSQDLFSEKGCMYVYQRQESFDKAQGSNQSRARNGVIFTELNSDDIRDLEPALKLKFAKGLLFENARQVLNPQQLVGRYFKTFLDNRGSYKGQHAAAVTALENPDRIDISLSDGNQISADQVVICSGAFSKQIRGAGVAALPLDTERGYHVQYAEQQSRLSRPVGWAEAGLYATPMNEGLRFAGTVEIAGLAPKINERNTRYLQTKADEMFSLNMPPSSQWLGYRPTMPDSLPVIGRSKVSERILYAFGHQHIGLTLAGITGKVISELAMKQTPSVDISAFSPDRFD